MFDSDIGPEDGDLEDGETVPHLLSVDHNSNYSSIFGGNYSSIIGDPLCDEDGHVMIYQTGDAEDGYPEDGDSEDGETVPHLLSVESIESTMFYAAKYLSKNFHQHSSRCRKRKYGKVQCAVTRPTDNTQG